jgi:hypothetical protein
MKCAKKIIDTLKTMAPPLILLFTVSQVRYASTPVTGELYLVPFSSLSVKSYVATARHRFR